MRRQHTRERRIIGGTGELLPPGPALGSSSAPAGPTPLLLTPENGDNFESDDTIILHAAIPGGAPAVTKVDFYQGSTLLGTANASPWEYQWTGYSASTSYSVTAKATYADATTGTSAAASITTNAARTFLMTSVAQLASWVDGVDSASITSASGVVQTAQRFRDNVKFTGDFTQATAGNRPILGRVRGRQAIFFNAPTKTLLGAITGTVGFPHTIFQVFQPIGQVAGGTTDSTNGVARIQYRGTTWPRTRRCQTSLTLDSTIITSRAELVEFLCNNTLSEVRVNGVSVNGPGVPSGTSGLTVNFVLGGGEYGSVGELVICNGALSAGDRQSISDNLRAKWHLDDPAFNVLQAGDSIARGFASSDLGGYRSKIWDAEYSRGKVAGHWIEEVGPTGADHVFGGDKHFGVDAKGVNYQRANLPALIGTTSEQFNPHIIVMLIGINNASGATGETYHAGEDGLGYAAPDPTRPTRTEWRNLVIDMLTKCPSATLIVANLPNNASAPTQTNVATLNASWFSDADSAAATLGKTVKHWDINAALGANPGVNFLGGGDLTHPSDAGYGVLASSLWPLIVQCASEL